MPLEGEIIDRNEKSTLLFELHENSLHMWFKKAAHFVIKERLSFVPWKKEKHTTRVHWKCEMYDVYGKYPYTPACLVVGLSARRFFVFFWSIRQAIVRKVKNEQCSNTTRHGEIVRRKTTCWGSSNTQKKNINFPIQIFRKTILIVAGIS